MEKSLVASHGEKPRQPKFDYGGQQYRPAKHAFGSF